MWWSVMWWWLSRFPFVRVSSWAFAKVGPRSTANPPRAAFSRSRLREAIGFYAHNEDSRIPCSWAWHGNGVSPASFYRPKAPTALGKVRGPRDPGRIQRLSRVRRRGNRDSSPFFVSSAAFSRSHLSLLRHAQPTRALTVKQPGDSAGGEGPPPGLGGRHVLP
jgi:hypothetical protein